MGFDTDNYLIKGNETNTCWKMVDWADNFLNWTTPTYIKNFVRDIGVEEPRTFFKVKMTQADGTERDFVLLLFNEDWTEDICVYHHTYGVAVFMDHDKIVV